MVILNTIKVRTIFQQFYLNYSKKYDESFLSRWSSDKKNYVDKFLNYLISYYIFFGCMNSYFY